jgi:uracil-DNA glycosylase
MSQPKPKIVFIDEQFSWKTDMLSDFLYEFGNIPVGYEDFFERADIKKIIKDLSKELYKSAQSVNIYPLMEDVFKALRCREPRVLIVGQDPYHNPNETNRELPGSAMGICFSLPRGTKYINPSFRSIQTEVADNGYSVDKNTGDISRWIDEGVLLLNSALTVEEGRAGSHTAKWVSFTEQLIEYISTKHSLVWQLWGKDAQAFEENIKNREKQYVLKFSHPCPMSASKPSGGNPPFLGSQFCKKTNEWLSKQGRKTIDWSIP